jgi:hypothetical protein
MSITLCLVQMQRGGAKIPVTLIRYGISLPLSLHSWLNIYTFVKSLCLTLAPYILPKENSAGVNTLFLITLIHTTAENFRREKKCISITSNSR